MKFADWMDREGVAAPEMAQRLGASVWAVTKWMYGQRVPGPEYLVKIAEMSNGEVLVGDFVESKRETAERAEAKRTGEAA